MTPLRALTIGCALAWTLGAIAAAQPSRQPAAPSPKLIVVLVVDQMRADYLDRYGARFTGGLNARILSNVMIGAAISTTFGKEQGNETSGHLGVKIGF